MGHRFTVILLLACLGRPLQSALDDPFNPPEPLSAEAHSLESPRLLLDDRGGAAMILSGVGTAGRRVLFYSARSLETMTATTIRLPSANCRAPCLIRGVMGEMHILFEAWADDTSDLYYATNRGGPFQEPVNVTRTPGRVETGVMVFPDAAGAAGQALWTDQDAAGEDQRLMVAPDMFTPSVLLADAAGLCGLWDPAAGQLNILLESRDLYYFLAYQPLSGGEPVLFIPAGIPIDVAMVMDPGDDALCHVVYSAMDGALYHCRILDGVPGFSRRIASSGSSPDLVLGADRAVHCLYGDGGDVWGITLQDASPDEPLRLLDLSQEITAFDGACDDQGFLHVMAVAGDQGWYQNNVPPAAPMFTAAPVSGEAPLQVRFSDESTGVVQAYHWTFGDGAESSQASPTHVYEAPGMYTVSLTVSGPGGGDVLVKEDLIEVVPSHNLLSLSAIPVWPGQTGVHHPVRVVHPEPMRGFQLALVHDAPFITAPAVSLAHAPLEKLSPEFLSVTTSDHGQDQGMLIAAMILDAEPPFDGRTLPPARRETLLCHLVYDVSPAMPEGAQVTFTFTDGLGDPPINNIFTVSGPRTVSPVLVHGSATAMDRPDCIFLRGDANQDGAVNLADPIGMLDFLFVDPGALHCPDACDVNDSGTLNLADPIYMLYYLFADAPAPAFPYPEPGVDHTPDDLLAPCRCE